MSIASWFVESSNAMNSGGSIGRACWITASTMAGGSRNGPEHTHGSRIEESIIGCVGAALGAVVFRFGIVEAWEGAEPPESGISSPARLPIGPKRPSKTMKITLVIVITQRSLIARELQDRVVCADIALEPITTIN